MRPASAGLPQLRQPLSVRVTPKLQVNLEATIPHGPAPPPSGPTGCARAASLALFPLPACLLLRRFPISAKAVIQRDLPRRVRPLLIYTGTFGHGVQANLFLTFRRVQKAAAAIRTVASLTPDRPSTRRQTIGPRAADDCPTRHAHCPRRRPVHKYTLENGQQANSVIATLRCYDETTHNTAALIHRTVPRPQRVAAHGFISRK